MDKLTTWNYTCYWYKQATTTQMGCHLDGKYLHSEDLQFPVGKGMTFEILV